MMLAVGHECRWIVAARRAFRQMAEMSLMMWDKYAVKECTKAKRAFVTRFYGRNWLGFLSEGSSDALEL